MATAAAVAMAAIASRMPRSLRTSMPRWPAAVSPRSSPSRIRARDAITRQATSTMGVATARRIHDDPARPPSRYEKISRRFCPDMYIAIVSSAARIDPTA